MQINRHAAAFVLAGLALVALALPLGAGAALAHEGHHAKCDETALNAIAADIQSMADGPAKDTATKEAEIARAMLDKHDAQACVTHVHAAMEAIEH